MRSFFMLNSRPTSWQTRPMSSLSIVRSLLTAALGAALILAANVPSAYAAKGVKKVGGLHTVRGQLVNVQFGGAGNLGGGANTGAISVRSSYSHRKFGLGGNNLGGNNLNAGNNNMGRGTQHVFQVTPATSVVATRGYQRSTGSLASLRQGMHVRVTAMNQVAQTVQVMMQGNSYGSYHRHYRPHYTGRSHRPYSYNHGNVAHHTSTTPKTTTTTKSSVTSLAHHTTPKPSTTKSAANTTNATAAKSKSPITQHHTVALHRSAPVHHSAPVHVSMPHFSAHHSSGGHHHGGHH